MKKLDIKKDENRHEKVKEVAKTLTTKQKSLRLHNISVRLTDEEYKQLLEQVEKTESYTISTFIKRCISLGIKKGL